MDNFAQSWDLHRYSDDLMIYQAYFEYIQLIQNPLCISLKRTFWAIAISLNSISKGSITDDELIEIIRNSPLKLIAIHSTETKTNLYPKHLSTIDDKLVVAFWFCKKCDYDYPLSERYRVL